MSHYAKRCPLKGEMFDRVSELILANDGVNVHEIYMNRVEEMRQRRERYFDADHAVSEARKREDEMAARLVEAVGRNRF